MQPFTSLTGIAAPLPLDDVNTDQIAPSGLRPGSEPDYKEMLFWRWRLAADGQGKSDFVLNQPQFREAKILVAGRNFGCGSSRESAVWALTANGIRCVIAGSFGPFFRDNCLQNGVLPVALPADELTSITEVAIAANGAAPFTVDLEATTVRPPQGPAVPFQIGDSERLCLLQGLDSIGLTMKHAALIRAWEERTRANYPWLQAAYDRRIPRIPRS